jgi:hypothetical protein
LGFVSLQHLRDRKSTRRGFATPARFRLQGLLTLWTAYSFRALAGFVSRRQRSWDSPCGAFSSRKVSAAFPRGCAHVPFFPSVIPPPKRWAGPTGRGFWVLTLPGVPGDRTGFNSPSAGCSLGLYPPRVCGREPGPSFCPGSSHTLSRFWSEDQDRRRLGVSIGSRLAQSTLSASRKGTPSNPLRVLAPVRARTREHPTAWAMCSPCTASHIAADCRYS